MLDRSWIKNLNPGDTVAPNGNRLAVVDRITPSGRIVIGDETYNPDGRMRGSSAWNHGWLMEATPEIVERIKGREIIDSARRAARRICDGKIEINPQQAQQLIGLVSGWSATQEATD